MKNIAHFYAATVLGSWLLVSATAHAQGAGASGPQSVEPPVTEGVADIVVYGQKRAAGEVAQRVPIAITAVDQRLLQATNSVSLLDVGSLAPNVQTNTTGTFPGFPNFSIRGIGLSSSIRSVDPAVNIVQDGLVLAYQAGAVLSTFDLEGIEILRGPQGVLFGRNATSGAFVLRTRRPSDEFGVRFDLSYGNFDALDVNTSVEGPLGSPNVLGKVAVLYRTNSGMFKNTNEGIFVPASGNPTGAAPNHKTGHIGDIDQLIIKPTFLFKASDATRLTLFTQYQRYNDDGTVPRNFQAPPGAVSTPSQSVFGYTPTTSGYDTNITEIGYVKIRAAHVIAELENEIGAGLLTTVAGYRKVSYDSTTNNAGTPFDGFLVPDNREDNDQYSIESRYNVTLTDGVDLTLGVFYLHSDTEVIERRRGTGATLSPRIYSQGSFDQRTKAYAGFANVDWAITSALKLSLGGRYSSEKKFIDYVPLAACTDDTFTTCIRTPLTAKKRWNNFSPRAVLSWQPAERVTVFGSFTRGFRSGNFNPRTTDTTGIGVGPADPETVSAYELGIKSDLFDRKARVNVSVFQSDYNAIQQVLTAPGAAVVQSLLNAADSRIRGVEGEFTLRPIPELELNTNVGYLDGQYRKFDIPIPGIADPTNLKFIKIPKWTVYLAGTYRTEIPSLNGAASLRVSYDWRSEYQTDFLNTPGLGEESYGLTHVDLTFRRDNWSASIFGRNLFNIEYADTKARNFAYIAYGGAPRTYGVRFTYQM
ncbi:TonB-dependent receptor [Sphingobium chlorophenolicum]|uniref:TonB-dependent receptor n=1 Tax=Sphingobium chlorophenolicum TaxID=46429 RepID=A0A081RFD0_SPHCR|nr:TonB-dependent receptor [Sphingobium chlorophenolicum]KEQ53903.1 TonB-dependent receptor precursor [Sphingobium chlorophenolicum]